MKIQHSLRAVALAAGVAAMVVMSGCKQGPVNYGKFEERTIEANLAAIDSASSIYAAQLAAGNIDTGVQQACAFLLTQPGVDTVEITPDSTVWAFFTSGLLAGMGDIRRDTTGDGIAASERQPNVRAQSGGEVSNIAHYVLPFNTELPGTQRAADALIGIFQRGLNWQNHEMFQGSAVDLEMALNLIENGNSVIFWSGHGMLVPPDTGSLWLPGLLLGKTYTLQAVANAAVAQYAGYLNPGPGQERQATVSKIVGKPGFYISILPGFIRAHGYFDASEATPGYNLCKTVVMLSCCYSAYSQRAAGAAGPLIQAFRDVGADVVCGYSWEVGDGFSCKKDTMFLDAMADTCLAREACQWIGDRIDPIPGRQGYHAQFQMFGDSLVMLQDVLQARKDGTFYKADWGVGVFQGESTVVAGTLHEWGGTDPVDFVDVEFPGSSPGQFDLTTTDYASIAWSNYASGHFWYAQKGYKGVSGSIQIDSCDGGKVFGSFSGTLGRWDSDHDPTKDPPDEVINITEGKIKHTGKLASGKAPGPRGHIARGMSGTLH